MKQKVDVVFSSADGQHIYVMVLRNSHEIGPEARLQFLFNDFAALFGAEDHVDIIFRERMRQCVAPCPPQHAQNRRMPGTPVAPSSLRRSAGWKATGLNAIALMLPRASALG